jgi:cytochrome c-type biogenesis protein CcmE
MYKYQMFGILIVGSLSCLGCSRPMIYYKTITELRQMGGEVQTRHLRVGGDIQCNSITRIAGTLRFNLVQEKQVLTVEYEGRRDSLPNTFRDGAQAVVDGHLGADGVFHASEVQARCQSMNC